MPKPLGDELGLGGEHHPKAKLTNGPRGLGGKRAPGRSQAPYLPLAGPPYPTAPGGLPRAASGLPGPPRRKGSVGRAWARDHEHEQEQKHEYAECGKQVED